MPTRNPAARITPQLSGDDRRSHEPRQKCETPVDVIARPSQQATEDAADAGDSPVKQYQHGNRGTDHKPACQGEARGEMVKVEQHDEGPYCVGQNCS